MSFLPDDLQAQIADKFPTMAGHVSSLNIVTSDEADDDLEIVVSGISSTHKLSDAIKDAVGKGFVLSFDEVQFKADKPANDVLKNPLVAAMYVADGFTVIATKDEDIMIFSRLQQRKETDNWGFDVSKPVKQ